MRLSKLAFALAVLGLVLPARSPAQDLLEGAVSSTAAAYDSYYAQGQEGDVKSPSDAPAPGDKGGEGAASGCGCEKEEEEDDPCCPKCCNSLCGWPRCCKLDCPEADVWRLIGERCFLGCQKYVVDGYIDMGATANGHNPASNFNGPISYNDRDEFQVNQVLVTLHRDIDAENEGWSWGGKAQLLYGTDARFIQSFGLELHQDGTNKWNGERFYQLAMPELFGLLAYDDWTFRFGKYVTQMTQETIDARSNFFYSHSYAFLYAVPFTHTGAVVTRPFQNINGVWEAGFFRGWERWEDDNDELAFQGHVQFNSEDNSSFLRLCLCSGDEAGINGVDANRTIWTVIFSKKFLCDRWQYVFVHDGGVQKDGVTNTAVPGGLQDAQWYSFGNYLIYQINCCWSAGFRIEAFRDDDGTRVAQTFSGNPTAGPFEGNFWEASWGLNWKPNDNVVVRPELRYDWFEGIGNPFDDGNATDQFTAAVDLIIHW